MALKTQSAPPKKAKYVLWSFFTVGNTQHSYILSLCIQYGWSKDHKTKAIKVADLGALDKWLRGTHKIGQSPVLKPLNDMSPYECSKVIHALEQMIYKTK
ncbi:hypothetical protein HSX10_03535 [Winogradskyella undariae]|jgi:hypothetical protein|uniref:hypothetical protein n=1 Tax=Winogradskyella undariae TaxID=1285465 RepID=UPI00156B1FE8|nr:hypothetical protein [Winogradskyella undariae]NRR90631.1 hypothetical protein [Winogradskyella undariae]